jgi:RNA 3'-terminal phosphate cyclase
MADQIPIYLALANGRSQVNVEDITQHVKTNIQVIEQILPVEFQVDYDKKMISVDGIDFKL